MNEHFILEQDIMRNVEDSNKGALRKEYMDAPEKTLERIQVVLRSPNVREQFDSYKNLMEYSVDIAEYSKSPEIKNLIVQELNSRFQLIRGQSEIETAHLFLWKQKIEQIEVNDIQ